jgi:predicted nucleic acid-binding protein
MSNFILDASVALACVLPDEKTPELIAWLDTLLITGDALVPANWWAEVGNGLLMAERRKRISDSGVALSLQDLIDFNVLQNEQMDFDYILSAAKISQLYHLTMYDALYLQLAVETSLPIAAFDRKMTSAARALNIPVLVAPMKAVV